MIPYKAKKATKKIDPKISNPPPTRPLCCDNAFSCAGAVNSHLKTHAGKSQMNASKYEYAYSRAGNLRT